MKDGNLHTTEAPGTQRRAWTAEEFARLRKIAAGKTRAKQLRELFPGRTLGSIKVHLHQVRRELGIEKRGSTGNIELSTRMLAPDDPGIYVKPWQEAQRPSFELANARYLAALQAA